MPLTAPPTTASAAHLRRLLLALAAVFSFTHFGLAKDGEWVGNLARNPGFEEDFVNRTAEGHVISFKGDWFYNQKDLAPDYWDLQGEWEHIQVSPHGGRFVLKLEPKATASQAYQRAMYHVGGGAWSAGRATPIPIAKGDQDAFRQPWRARVWARHGGTLAFGNEQVSAEDGEAWQLLEITLPKNALPAPDKPVQLTLKGPGQFDDVWVEEMRAPAPNLAANPSFEQVENNYPKGWSQQKKYRAIGPTYYVWTDWNHCFAPNRGPVLLDKLIARSGQHSLRFDVYPGDEKMVESELITINQDQPRPIEVGVFVRADRIKLIDIRCVDQDGIYMPGRRPREPEYRKGGTFAFGNGTFEWRYIRKFFSVPEHSGTPVTGIRVRLCARGMNGHTLDDAGTRSYAMQVGTVWWDDLYVTERTSNAEALAKRGVKAPPAKTTTTRPFPLGQLDLGDRYYGDNKASFTFRNDGKPATYQLAIDCKLPDQPSVSSKGEAARVATGGFATLTAPYRVDALAPELLKQGTLKLTVLRNGTAHVSETYAFNTWPVVVDFDLSRHFTYKYENPMTVSMNVGVASETLANVKKMALTVVRLQDEKVIATHEFRDPASTFASTVHALPKAPSFEFDLPTPAFWTDRTNLIVTKINTAKMRIWPHDHPVRDHVLEMRGFDQNGKELFRGRSQTFGKMEPPPPQAAIDNVKIRDDGAVLINGEPKFLTGATHQNNRLRHTIPIIAQMGLMGHRLLQGKSAEFKNIEKIWEERRLYALQIKPVSGQSGTIAVTSMTDEQKQALAQFADSGGMRNVISVNTGGWEATIDAHDQEIVKKHSALNEWVYKTTKRPLAISTSGAYNAWWIPELPFYDIFHAETEMWGPMDFNVIMSPYMKRLRKRPTAWLYLPQLYDNTPFERYRFETYENIIRGSAGVSMIQGIGDATFNRGLAGELRYLEKPLNSLEKAPAVKLAPRVSHKVTRHGNKTYILATNAGPIRIGVWKWDKSNKHSGRASHEGDTINSMWYRPAGIRIHGFRGLALPEKIQKGDKIVQYIWLDPKETPQWAMLAIRGDGRFVYNSVYGKFNYETFRKDAGNVVMYSELNHAVWHAIGSYMDDATYQRAVKIMGKKWADKAKAYADKGRKKVDEHRYQAEHFRTGKPLPAAGQWHRLEIDAAEFGLVGKLVDGFAYLTQNGRALWDHTVLERNGQVVRVFCEDSVGIDRKELEAVRFTVPGVAKGTKIKVLFENRTLECDENGSFVDNFVGIDSYGYESQAPEGDLLGYVKDPDRELPRLLPSGYGYNYGPTAVHIYEIEH